MLQARYIDAREQACRGTVIEMTELAGDAPLDRLRIVAVRQHLEIVVAFEHQCVAARQARLHVRGGDAEVGQHTQPPASIGAHELHRLASVVRHRKRMNLDRVDREAIMTVEAPHARKLGEALRDDRERSEGEPDGGAEASGERRDTADVVAVLMGDQNR